MTLADPTRKAAVVADGVRLVEAEVERKGGLRGMAVKAGFKVVKSVKPGILATALDRLLPEFAPAVDPHFTKARESGDVERYFTTNAGTIADAMLGVTDRRAERADNAVLKKAYAGLRGQAKEHVVEAMPGLARLITKHVR